MDFNDPRWQETADALGMPLEDLLTAISYETAGTMNPMKAGPTTKWGKHRGLIQFGEPQAKQHGVDFSTPEAALDSQLGAEGAIVKYMLGSGYKPGEHGFLDFYSTINAGAPGLHNRSDAGAGGAPGTVLDKVTSQMSGHRANAQKWLGGGQGPSMNADGSISRSASLSQDNGVASNARKNSAGANADLGYKQVPDWAGGKMQAGLAKKIGGKRMAGLGGGLMNISSMLMDEDNAGMF